MGLFDRLRGGDDSEEVELRPQTDFDRTRRRVNNPNTGRSADAPEQEEEVDLEEMWDSQRQNRDGNKRSSRNRRDSGSKRTAGSAGADDTDTDDSDEFILPGMKSVADDETDEDAAGATGNTGGVDPSDERLDQLLEQNERIIALLEEIADMAGEETDTGSAVSDNGMW